MRQTLFRAFFEDEIKLKKTLTVNAGLRYEMVTVPTESHGLTTVLRNLTAAVPVCGVSATGCAGTGPLSQIPTLRNFEPRLGFAWNPAGARLSSEAALEFLTFCRCHMNSRFPFSGPPHSRELSSGRIPGGSFRWTRCGGGYQQFINQTDTNLAYYAEPKPKRDYVMQWNLSVARELTSTLGADRRIRGITRSPSAFSRR